MANAVIAPLQFNFKRWRAAWVAFGQFLIVVVGGVVSALLVMGIPAFTQVDLWTQDVRMIYGPKAPAQDKDIIIVKIDENLLRRFPYRYPVDRQYLAGLLTTLAAKHARAIGLDFLFDKPTEPTKDEILRRTLRQLPVPVVVSYVQDPRIVDPRDLPFLQNFVPPDERGMANIPNTRDGDVRYIYPGERGPDGVYIRGLARQILHRLGIETPDQSPELYYMPDPRESNPYIPLFGEIPAEAVPYLPAKFFTGKIVLIGADLSLDDRHRTPMATMKGDIDGQLPGIVIHAHGLSQLLNHRGVKHIPQWSVLAITVVLAALGAILGRLPMPIWGRLLATFIFIATWIVAAFEVYMNTLWVVPVVAPSLAFVLAVWITDTILGRESRQQKAFIQGAMSRYVSPKVVSQLLDNPEQLSLTGISKEMTFLFTDVAGFTSLAEKQGPEKLIALLNEYLTGVCRIIQEQYEGTVCRFIGDAIFALWNAPADQPDHHRRAVECALAIDAYAEAFRAEQLAKGVEFGATRIGVNAGVAMVGNLGSPERMEYTALGDNVNLASRLESVNKYFGTRICVSETVASALPPERLRPIARVVVKGKTQPMAIYEPIDPDKIGSTSIRNYMAAYALLEAENPRALDAFKALATEDPDDGCARFHYKRLQKLVVPDPRDGSVLVFDRTKLKTDENGTVVESGVIVVMDEK
jgi:class 3 adenylate cyclase/CHASE2 domain-containing sensor protein